MNYLTVQDMIWINQQVTQKVQHFKFAQLEEATHYQQGYGVSTNLVAQATKFYTGFLKLAPFEKGNEGTAFLALLTFLHLNGKEFKVKPKAVGEWIKTHTSLSTEELEAAIKDSEDHGHGDLKSVVRGLFDSYEKEILSLEAEDVS